MSDAVKNLRLQLTNTRASLWVPLVILGATVVLQGVVVAIIDSNQPVFGGAANAPVWYFLVLGAQAILSCFPFAIALGSTRLGFTIGLVLMALLSGAFLGTAALLIGLIEKATDGWGVGSYVYYIPWIWNQGPLIAWVVFIAAVVVMYMIGMAVMVVVARWNVLVLVVTTVLLLLAALLGLRWFVDVHGWAPLVQWFSALTPAKLAGWLALLSLVCTGLGFGIIRKLPARQR